MFIKTFSHTQILVKRGLKNTFVFKNHDRNADNYIWYFSFRELLIIETQELTSYNGKIFSKINATFKLLKADPEAIHIVQKQEKETKEEKKEQPCKCTVVITNKINTAQCK